MYTNCYYSNKSKTVVTFPHPEKEGLSLYGTPICELKQAFPDMELMSLDDATKSIHEAFRAPLKAITEDQYNYALEVLPPENWKNINGGEYFQMMEYLTGNITHYYIRHKGLFYSFTDSAWFNPTQVTSMLDDFLSTLVQ